MTTRDDWHKRTRNQRLSAVLYPNLTDQDTRRQMQSLSANEGKRPPSAQALLPEHKRGSLSPLGGEAKRSQQRR